MTVIYDIKCVLLNVGWMA